MSGPHHPLLAFLVLVATWSLVSMAAFSMAVQHAEAQSIPHISISTGSDVYHPGETIRVGGAVDAVHGGAVTIKVVSPAGGVVAVGQVVPDGRAWSWTVPAEFAHPGTYAITAHYALASDPDRHATTTFVYSTAVDGTAIVDGTELAIDYTSDAAIVSARTDPEGSLVYIEFAEPDASGVMRFQDGLHEGGLVAVSGGTITVLPDGSVAFSTDSRMMVLAADAVAVPEFGAAMLAAALAAAALPLARRLRP